jgi:hypothetical protein
LKQIINTFFLLLLLVKCTEHNQKKEPVDPIQKTIRTKPGSSYCDTLAIKEACAILYQPDSVQKEKIKAVTEVNVFESSVHEFFYLQRNARIFLKKNWPHLKVIEVNKYRYLLFLRKNQAVKVIDLNQLGDSYGMILFDPFNSPQQVDMMNIETEVPRYFKRHR